MTLGQRLYEMRKEKGFSQEKVAEALGVTRQTISKWETDQTTPDFDKILPLCELYNITTEELLRGEEKPKNTFEYGNTDTNYSYCDESRYNIPQTEPEPEPQEKAQFEKRRIKSVLLMSIAISLYILSVIPFFVLNNSKIMLTAFFVIIAAATMMIVFAVLSKPKATKKNILPSKENRLYKMITSILSGVILIIYMLISFITGAWNITWLLWVIYGILCEIIKLIFLLKGSEVNDEE